MGRGRRGRTCLGSVWIFPCDGIVQVAKVCIKPNSGFFSVQFLATVIAKYGVMD